MISESIPISATEIKKAPKRTRLITIDTRIETIYDLNKALDKIPIANPHGIINTRPIIPMRFEIRGLALRKCIQNATASKTKGTT